MIVVSGDHNLLRVMAPRSPRQVNVSIRVRKLMLMWLHELSLINGTPLAQLCRELILIGAVLGFTRFQDPKEVEYLTRAVDTSTMASSVNRENPFKEPLMGLAGILAAIARDEPARNRRSREGTQHLRIWLPKGFLGVVDGYAKLVRATRSAILIHFLVKGYILYLGSQIMIKKAMWQATRKSSSPTAGPTGSGA